jgi:hypothetical protein
MQWTPPTAGSPADVAQLAALPTCNRAVPGSSPGVGSTFPLVRGQARLLTILTPPNIRSVSGPFECAERGLAARMGRPVRSKLIKKRTGRELQTQRPVLDGRWRSAHG